MSDNRTEAQTSAASEAAEWYVRLRKPDLSEMEAARFRAWLQGDPSRRREFDDIDAFWEELSVMEHSWQVRRVRKGISARNWRERARVGYLAAAATLVISVGAAWVAWQQFGAGYYATHVGEQRVVSLEDGSFVTLNTATEIRLHYSDRAREIELVRGEANFDVAHDTRRPFIVRAGGGRVRALGTVFDVYKSADKVTVTLIEGKLAVAPHPSDEAAPASRNIAERSGGATAQARHAAWPSAPSEIILAPGEQVSFATTRRVVKFAGVVKLPADEISRATAWRAHRLDFRNTLLTEAIAEANRYSHEQIVLDVPELGDARISGTFEAGQNGALVEGLQAYFQLDVERGSDRELILTRRPD